jgi:hypothetical protein
VLHRAEIAGNDIRTADTANGGLVGLFLSEQFSGAPDSSGRPDRVPTEVPAPMPFARGMGSRSPGVAQLATACQCSAIRFQTATFARGLPRGLTQARQEMQNADVAPVARGLKQPEKVRIEREAQAMRAGHVSLIRPPAHRQRNQRPQFPENTRHPRPGRAFLGSAPRELRIRVALDVRRRECSRERRAA